MHDSLECRIGGVWARCVATKWVHSLWAGSVTGALLVGFSHGLPDVPILTKTISFKPHEAAGSALFDWAGPFNVLQWISNLCWFILLRPLFLCTFLFNRCKEQESWSPTCFKSFIRNLNHCFYVYFIEKMSWNVSGLIPLGWTAQNRALGFARQNLKGSVPIHHQQAKQQTTPKQLVLFGIVFYCETLQNPTDLKVTDLLIEARCNSRLLSATMCIYVCAYGCIRSIMFSIHWCPPKSLLSLDIWYILLPENKYHLIFLTLHNCPPAENITLSLVLWRKPCNRANLGVVWILPSESSRPDGLRPWAIPVKEITVVLITDLTNYRVPPSNALSRLEINSKHISLS